MRTIISLVFFAILACAPSSNSGEDLKYFCEIALGTEFGKEVQVIKKWRGPLRIKIHGYPGKRDLEVVDQVLAELKSLTNLEIEMVEAQENIYLFFLPEKNFKSRLKQYQPVNYGFFWTWWKSDYRLFQAVILISTTKIKQVERDHLIREEITQALGLMKDSKRFADSIFQAAWTQTTSYSPLDRRIIKMLYDPSIKPGMSKQEVIKALSK